MEKVSDFFKDIQERLSNPLFSSFLVSWGIINWQIPVALIFYNNDTLKIDGYGSYIDLILKKSSIWNYFGYPLLLAIVYTFLFPFIRNGILAFQTWIKTWGNDLNLKISRRGKISTERYIQMREKYYKLNSTLEELLSSETSYVQKNNTLIGEKAAISIQLNELSDEISRWRNMNDPSILNGDWDYSFKTSITKEEKKYRLTIVGGNITMFSDITKQTLLETYNIQNFFCNPINSRLCFTLQPTKSSQKSAFYNLQSQNNFSELHGTEDLANHVFFNKLPSKP